MKKGFTLVELLTVVVVIGLISLLMMPRILERFQNKKNEISLEAENMLNMAVYNYLQTHSNVSCVTISELIDSGDLIYPVKDIINNTILPNSAAIKITVLNNQYSYEYSSEGCL